MEEKLDGGGLGDGGLHSGLEGYLMCRWSLKAVGRRSKGKEGSVMPVIMGSGLRWNELEG